MSRSAKGTDDRSGMVIRERISKRAANELTVIWKRDAPRPSMMARSEGINDLEIAEKLASEEQSLKFLPSYLGW